MSNHWAGQSPVTDPGRAAQTIDDLPAEIGALREASSRLVFHYRAGGDLAGNGIPPERMAEINTMYADDILALLLGRGEPNLARDRQPADRVVGCCRDATVLFLALARHKGIPARARVGFSAYFEPGWLINHTIAEVWDDHEGRWRLVDPEMDIHWTPEVNGHPVDWLDLADDQFVIGPRAWQAARAGKADPARYVVFPEIDVPRLRGWPHLAHNAIHDLAALNKIEMVLWDVWGMDLDHGAGQVPEADATVIDEVCALTANPGASPGDLVKLGEHDRLRVTPEVTRFDPHGAPPHQVDVSRALSGKQAPGRTRDTKTTTPRTSGNT